jgi:cobalt-zinc-cadmium resistance protein CzcA
VEGVPYQKNDTDLLARITSETLYASFQNDQFKAEQQVKLAQNEFSLVLNSEDHFAPADTFLDLYAIQIRNMGPDKFSAVSMDAKFDESVLLQKRNIEIEQSRYFPDIKAGYFNQQIDRNKGYQGFYLGFSIPIWFFPQKAKISRAKINLEISKNESDYQKLFITKKIESLRISLDQMFVNISFYRENSLKRSDLLINDAIKQIRSKSIQYRDCLEKLQEALTIQLMYLESLRTYNETAIELESYID